MFYSEIKHLRGIHKLKKYLFYQTMLTGNVNEMESHV